MADAPSPNEFRDRVAIAALWTEHDRLVAALRWISDQAAVAGTTVLELGTMADDTLKAAGPAACVLAGRVCPGKHFDVV
jgi:hypothetical protein